MGEKTVHAVTMMSRWGQETSEAELVPPRSDYLLSSLTTPDQRKPTSHCLPCGVKGREMFHLSLFSIISGALPLVSTWEELEW